ncbi:MAG: sigma-70 family RNA polymerase sigma factor [Planctomycetota bacterium]
MTSLGPSPAAHDLHPWSQHFERVEGTAVRWLQRRGFHDADARDVWQQVVAQVLESGSHPDPDRAPDAYLWTVTRREAGRLHGRARVPSSAECGVPASCEDTSAGPTDECLRGERRRAVREAVGTLPAPFRQVVERRYFEGQSVAQVATALSIPGSTVATRTFRALRMLEPRLRRLRSAVALPGPWWRWLSRLAAAALVSGALLLVARDAQAGTETAPVESLEPAEPVEPGEQVDAPCPTRGFPYGDDAWVLRPMPEA